MHEGVDLLATLYPLCFFRAHELRRPLKIGTREDIIAQHPELQPGVIESALQIYTRCVPYWSTLEAGAPRIDLAGNVAGEVTAADEEDAKRKIANEARRAAAGAMMDCKVAGEPAAKPVAERPGQQNPIPEAKSEQSAPARPPRVGLAGLKAAAQARRARLVAAE